MSTTFSVRSLWEENSARNEWTNVTLRITTLHICIVYSKYFKMWILSYFKKKLSKSFLSCSFINDKIHKFQLSRPPKVHLCDLSVLEQVRAAENLTYPLGEHGRFLPHRETMVNWCSECRKKKFLPQNCNFDKCTGTVVLLLFCVQI